MPPGKTRSPSIAISAGSSVTAVRIETATTVIAPSAIERSAWLSTIQRPARETITARPEKATARPEVDSASARAASLSRPLRPLLAVAGEDEERVVDRHPDPDHRGHVGDEDRGLHLQREEVDQRAGDDHADEAERQRQRRGGERAEDDEQDQRDDREAAGLGFGEVFLGELLHPGPDRRLPGQVGGDSSSAVPGSRSSRRSSPSRSGGRRSARCAGAASPSPVRCSGNSPRRAAAGGRVTSSRSATARRTRSTAAARCRGARAVFGLQQHRDPAGLGAEVVLERVADRLRLAAGDVEAAAGQVIGLVRGDRQRRQQGSRARQQDPAPPAAQEACELDHQVAHWLVGQPFERTASRL